MAELSNRDIICFSTHYWDERRFRKQEFMSRFSRANRVLFVEPSFSMVRSTEGHLEEIAENRFLLSSLEAREQNLHLLKPPRGLPKWHNPAIHRLNYRWYGRIVGRAARRLGFRNSIVWLYPPSYFYALSEIPHERIVFDLVDDLSAYGAENLDHVEELTEKLIDASDLVLVTAKTLLDRYRDRAAEIVQIPNGFDDRLFSPDRIGSDLPDPLREIPSPRIGMVGTLFTFLDFELLEMVADSYREASIVLVGPTERNVEREVAKLCEKPNVIHLGSRLQAEVPGYVAGFDVCLNPFQRGRLADSVSPLKVYEYLAMGRPVVSTPMRALQMEEIADQISFAADAAEFCARIGDALGGDDDRQRQARRAAVSRFSWDSLFQAVDSTCASEFSQERCG